MQICNYVYSLRGPNGSASHLLLCGTLALHVICTQYLYDIHVMPMWYSRDTHVMPIQFTCGIHIFSSTMWYPWNATSKSEYLHIRFKQSTNTKCFYSIELKNSKIFMILWLQPMLEGFTCYYPLLLSYQTSFYTSYWPLKMMFKFKVTV